MKTLGYPEMKGPRKGEGKQYVMELLRLIIARAEEFPMDEDEYPIGGVRDALDISRINAQSALMLVEEDWKEEKK